MDLGDDELRRCKEELRALHAMPGAAALLNERLGAFLRSSPVSLPKQPLRFIIRGGTSDRWALINKYKATNVDTTSTECMVIATVRINTEDMKTIEINGTMWMMMEPNRAERGYWGGGANMASLWEKVCAGVDAITVDRYDDASFYLKTDDGIKELQFSAMHTLRFQTDNYHARMRLREQYNVTEGQLNDRRCNIAFQVVDNTNDRKAIEINGITFTTDVHDTRGMETWNKLVTGVPASVLEYYSNSFSVGFDSGNITFKKQPQPV